MAQVDEDLAKLKDELDATCIEHNKLCYRLSETERQLSELHNELSAVKQRYRKQRTDYFTLLEKAYPAP